MNIHIVNLLLEYYLITFLKNLFQPSYRLAIRTEGMIEDLVKNLKSENAELQMHCASAIFKVKSPL